MRLIATFFTLVALAAASLAGKDLHAALSQATPQVTPEDLTRAVQEVATPPAPAEPLIWPALFGEPEPPKPPTPPQAPVQVVEEPQPPAKKPPAKNQTKKRTRTLGTRSSSHKNGNKNTKYT